MRPRAYPMNPIARDHFTDSMRRRFRSASLPLLLLLLQAFSLTASAPSVRAQESTPLSERAAPGIGAVVDTVLVDVTGAVERSLAISPEVRASRAGVDFARARHNLARSSRVLTQFSAQTAHSTSPGIDNPNDVPTDELYLDPDVRNDWEDLGMYNQLEVEAIQPIWTWGELGGNIRAARAGIGVEEAGVQETRVDVAVRTAELYYSLLLAESLDRLTQEAGDIVDQAKDEINRLLDDGDPDVDDADLFQVQITEQEFLQRVVEVRERRRTAQVALRRQLFLPEGVIVDPRAAVLTSISFELDSLETYQQIALQNRSELLQAESGLEAREALVNVARSKYFPQLFLGITADYAYAPGRYRQRNPYHGDRFLSRSVEAGIGFRQNLNFGQTKARVEQARAERAEVRYQQDAARQLVLFEVEEAYRNVIIKRAAADARSEALTISDEWLRVEQVNFDLALGNTENLVKAVRENLQLQAAEHQAVFEYNRAVLRLWQAMGVADRYLESGMLVD